METQEQKMVERLSMRRMEIEMLRCEVLFRYYERLLGLDVINDRDEVKSIMTCINTLERYARKYEKKFEELFANQKEAMPEVAVSESDSPKEANRVADIDMDRGECELPDIEDREQSQVPLVAPASLLRNNQEHSDLSTINHVLHRSVDPIVKLKKQSSKTNDVDRHIDCRLKNKRLSAAIKRAFFSFSLRLLICSAICRRSIPSRAWYEKFAFD